MSNTGIITTYPEDNLKSKTHILLTKVLEEFFEDINDEQSNLHSKCEELTVLSKTFEDGTQFNIIDKDENYIVGKKPFIFEVTIKLKHDNKKIANLHQMLASLGYSHMVISNMLIYEIFVMSGPNKFTSWGYIITCKPGEVSNHLHQIIPLKSYNYATYEKPFYKIFNEHIAKHTLSEF